MKKYHNALLSTIVSLSILISPMISAAPQVVEKVAAIVNKDIVLESDVNRMIAAIKGSVQDTSQLPSSSELRSQVIERLILESLILQEAMKAKIRVTDEILNQEITQIAEDNGLTIDELRANLASAGISYVEYQDRIKKDIQIEEVRNRVVKDRVIISPQEVDSLVKHLLSQPETNVELNISQIFLPLPEAPKKADLEKVQDIVKTIMTRLSKRTNFDTLAKTYSADPNAMNGGKMGWKRLDELPSVFVEKMGSPQKGQVVGPVRSASGMHIIRINDIRGAKQQEPKKVSAEEVHARHILLQSSVLKTDQELQETLKAIRQNIIDGKDTFEAVATTISEDPGSAPNGGDLGWNLPERYDPAFKDALLKLRVGDISQPIKSAYGWHLIQLIDKREIDRTDAAQREQAYRMIFNRKFSEELQTWMQELRAGAYVKILDETSESDQEDN